MYNTESKNYPPVHPRPDKEYDCAISARNIADIFADCCDFEQRSIDCGSVTVSVCWIDGVCSGGDISQDVLRPITEGERTGTAGNEAYCIELLARHAVYSYSMKRHSDVDKLVGDLTHGHCAVIFDGLGEALCFEVRSDKTRSVSEPSLEKSIKGGKDSFVETLRVNTALVRRRLCSPKLKVTETIVGRKSDTHVAVMYYDGIVAPETLEKLLERLDSLDVEALLSTGTLEEYIVDSPRSPFPQLLHTERPDRFAMYLMEGRIGLLIDGLPVALVLPATFADFMKVTDDSSNNYIVGTSLGILRYTALMLGLLFPALYVAMATYHQEMIPSKLLLSIIEAKQNVPFSTSLEVIGMLLAFSFLQEAGLRLPNPIGNTVSIIGALIVGQSAVEAKVVSPIAIIVVAVSAISCYTLPSQDMGAAVRLCSLGFVLSAAVAGLFGVGVACCLLILQLAKMNNFGVNYTAPISDDRPFPIIRLLIQRPKPKDKYRSPELNTPDRRRQA